MKITVVINENETKEFESSKYTFIRYEQKKDYEELILRDFAATGMFTENQINQIIFENNIKVSFKAGENIIVNNKKPLSVIRRFKSVTFEESERVAEEFAFILEA